MISNAERVGTVAEEMYAIGIIISDEGLAGIGVEGIVMMMKIMITTDELKESQAANEKRTTNDSNTGIRVDGQKRTTNGDKIGGQVGCRKRTQLRERNLGLRRIVNP